MQKALRPYADWYKITSRLDGFPKHHLTRGLHPGSGTCIKAYEWVADPGQFMTLALEYGPPEKIRLAFYEAVGARYKAPVPHTSLPKEFA